MEYFAFLLLICFFKNLLTQNIQRRSKVKCSKVELLKKNICLQVPTGERPRTIRIREIEKKKKSQKVVLGSNLYMRKTRKKAQKIFIDILQNRCLTCILISPYLLISKLKAQVITQSFARKSSQSRKKVKLVASHLGIAEDSSTAKCSIWGNMELRASNFGYILRENSHQEA